MHAHRGAFEYDWRTRFHLPLAAVGRAMGWGEAYRLTQRLAGDPSSAVATALNDWDYPMTREAMVLADVFDSSEANRVGRKAKAYPRPWSKTRRTYGSTALTRQQLRAILDTHRR